MIAISVVELCKSFLIDKGYVRVLDNISVNINAVEVTVIRGENGCGKTTFLSIIAGFLAPTSGTIAFPERKGEKQNIGFVFQDFSNSLFPWRTAMDNICLPLEIQEKSKKNRYHEADEILDLLGFDDIPLTYYPHQLSGGQKHRVAIARSLISRPSVLLFDEPFANLDVESERRLKRVIHFLREKLNVTVVLVTHDIDTSIILADRIVVLSSRPASIVAEIAVNLPRPRLETYLYDEHFYVIRRQILEMEGRVVENNKTK